MSTKAQKVAYLGPVGTFSQDAAEIVGAELGIPIEPYSDVPAILDGVSTFSGTLGLVPIENSVQGEVTITMDSLVFSYERLYVIGEVVVPVTFCAFRRSGNNLLGINKVISHPHALAQCLHFTRKLGIPTANVSSTAEACRIVAADEDNCTLAISSERAGSIYNLSLVDRQIEDFHGAATKFFLVSDHLAECTGNDKTMIAAVPQQEGKGTLVKLLGSISDRDLDIYSIHSRPLKSSLGRYCFVIAFEGHARDSVSVDLLSEMVACKTMIKILGSFPVWKGSAPSAPFRDIPGTVKDISTLNKLLIREV